MKRTLTALTVGAAMMSACSMFPSEGGNPFDDDFASAFESAPTALSLLQSSFSSSADSLPRIGGPEGFGFGPGGPRGGGPGGPGGRGRGPGGPGMGLGPGFGMGGLGMMGGLAPEFFGGREGRGPRGPFSDSAASNCTFDAASGRAVCPANVRDGITMNRSMAFTTSAGVVQSAFDSTTTNTINTRITVSGTTTRGAMTRVVNHASNRTVSGLLGSTRTVNGTSSGNETSTGTHGDTTFTAVRTAGDTTTGLVIPVSTDERTYPTAGTVIRRMVVTLTRGTNAPRTSDRREVITYNGSATASLVITRDGTTKTCTIALPHGRPECD
jgi:hypothetical protein